MHELRVCHARICQHEMALGAPNGETLQSKKKAWRGHNRWPEKQPARGQETRCRAVPLAVLCLGGIHVGDTERAMLELHGWLLGSGWELPILTEDAVEIRLSGTDGVLLDGMRDLWGILRQWG